jgi:diamine N-acetyltransferase
MRDADLTIMGERVYLRKMTEDDALTVVQWRNDPQIKKWMFNQNELSVESHVTWYKKQKYSNRHDFIICDRITGKGIGTVNFINIKGRQAEAGKMLGNSNYWGAGYAKEAFRIWLNYGFVELGFEKIYVKTMKNNTPNIKLNKKLGFKIKEEVMFHHDGLKFDILVMEIIQDDLL